MKPDYIICYAFWLQVVQETGEKLRADSNLLTDEIKQRLDALNQSWQELNENAANRGQKLDESLAYQQFAANVEEEEAWITEKQHLLSGDDYGDTLAAVQVRIYSWTTYNFFLLFIPQRELVYFWSNFIVTFLVCTFSICIIP